MAVPSDPFSSYRPGFEVRTYRRCHRILTFHHFPDEPGVGANCLVGSTDLTYTNTGGSGMTTVASVTHTGYRRRQGGGYHIRRCRRWNSRYSKADLGHELRDLAPEALQNMPTGMDGTSYQWVDLDGEGLSGVLSRQGGAWYYRPIWATGGSRRRGCWQTSPRWRARPTSGTARPGRRRPSGRWSSSAAQRPASTSGPTSELAGVPPVPLDPNISWDDPNLRMVDLDGDGLADVLITGDDAFTWYPSLGADGFGEGQRAFSPSRGARSRDRG